MNEAKQLWRERLRFEYLQEKLGKIAASKPSEGPAGTNAPPGKSTDHPGSPPVAASAAQKQAPKPKTDAEQIVKTLTHRYHRPPHLRRLGQRRCPAGLSYRAGACV